MAACSVCDYGELIGWWGKGHAGKSHCRDCHRSWSGQTQAHCAACHEHFSTAGNFDSHRQGGSCGDLSGVERRCGAPRFRRVAMVDGLTWVANVHEPSCGFCQELPA